MRNDPSQRAGVDGRAVANYILDFCDARKREVTNLSLQKILYFCHVWTLVRLDRPLVRHQFEAWEYGPVLDYVYRDFKDCEDRPIGKRALFLDANTGTRRPAIHLFDESTKAVLDEVIETYSQLSPGELVCQTHAPGGPWELVWNHSRRINPGMKLENVAIKKFYSNRPLSKLQ